MKPNGPLALSAAVASAVFAGTMAWAAVKTKTEKNSDDIVVLQKENADTKRTLWHINGNIELLMRASGVKPLPKE